MTGSTHSRRPATSALVVHVRGEPPGAEVDVGGELDMITATRLNAEVSAMLVAGYRVVVMDLRDLSFLSAAGMRVLLESDERLRAVSGQLVLAGTSPITCRLLRIAGLDEVLTIG